MRAISHLTSGINLSDGNFTISDDKCPSHVPCEYFACTYEHLYHWNNNNKKRLDNSKYSTEPY